MVRARGTYFIVGYGGKLSVPTFKLVLPEISVVGNAVGTHDDLRELMALDRGGDGQRPHPAPTRSTLSPTPSTTSKRTDARPRRPRAMTTPQPEPHRPR